VALITSEIPMEILKMTDIACCWRKCGQIWKI